MLMLLAAVLNFCYNLCVGLRPESGIGGDPRHFVAKFSNRENLTLNFKDKATATLHFVL